MDNLTHSIIGFGVGELAHRCLPPEATPAQQRTRHRLLLLGCALANNFPDLDLLLMHGLPAPLSYLMYHRGHTHTALLALPQALLLLALLWLCWPAARALLKASAAARLGLALTVPTGLALHLLMDYTNSYGVHPFYPFDGRWLYGDMVFIVEPLFWAAIGVPLALIVRWRWLRVMLLAGLGLVLLACTLRGYLGWPSLAGLTLLALSVGWTQRRADAGPHRAAGMLLALGLSTGFIATQGAASQLGRQQISAALQRIDPAAQVVDVAMTAFPSQPLCWNFVSVERNEGAGQYRLRRGVVSVAPHWLAPQACPAGLREPGTVLASTDGVAALLESGSVSASLAQLRALQQSNCSVDAWLRFARAPALVGQQLGDYRFAATPRGNFTTLDVAEAQSAGCAPPPAWGYPRADLLTPP
ncbi:MAG: metal-dependent hydrolase [Sphingomonadaceae bacterium]